ncbi:hypothetical protein DCAR_0518590 [Daucus carota subsp. sativus]|uniref:Uncharacterized protein n=1 Tax=Daucus carota subsp. sativus TaxID=79200 RepID=A0A164XCK5_DAUCS|nr:hypothetical protein DCAR_0518590 [Daucus carota subsp. sativus]
MIIKGNNTLARGIQLNSEIEEHNKARESEVPLVQEEIPNLASDNFFDLQ